MNIQIAENKFEKIEDPYNELSTYLEPRKSDKEIKDQYLKSQSQKKYC